MGRDQRIADAPRNPWRAWQDFGGRHGALAAVLVFGCGLMVHAVLSHVFSTAYADEIERLLEELYVFQCVPLEPADPLAVGALPRPPPRLSRLRELDVTSVRVLFIERAVAGLGEHREEAARVVADVLRYDPDLNARAGAVLALSYLGADAAPALPDLLHAVVDAEEDIRLRRLILDKLPDIEPAPEAVTPVLAAMLRSEPDAVLRSKAAKALIDIDAARGR